VVLGFGEYGNLGKKWQGVHAPALLLSQNSYLSIVESVFVNHRMCAVGEIRARPAIAAGFIDISYVIYID
jgi:hypothetical protein